MFFKIEKPETIKFYNLIKEQKPFIVFDLETSGKKSTVDWIVQFSANRYEVINGIYQKVATLNEYIKIPVWMDQEVVNIHGITNEFLENKPTENEIFPVIEKFMDTNAVIAGYNIVKFDIKFMDEMYKRQGKVFEPQNVVDIYKIAKENIYPNDIKNEEFKYSLKLSNVVEYLNISEDINFHSADEDIYATWLCGIKLLKHHKKYFMINHANKYSCEIKRMSLYKKSSTVNRIYTEIIFNGRVGKIYWDIPKNAWVDVNDNNILEQINVFELHQKVKEIMEKRNCDFKTFEGVWENKERIKLYA